MIDFWVNILEKLRNHKDIAVLYVMNSKGSSPGRAGFRMLVSSHGEMYGSIGGGIMEHKLVEHARQLMEKGPFKPFIKQQIHQADIKKNKSGMICSGEQTIGFFFLSSKDHEMFATVVDSLRNNQKVGLSLSQDGLQFLPIKGGFTIGLKMGTDEKWQYQEVLHFSNTIYIVGGGHVGLALSEIMCRLGFYVCILDDRSNLNTVNINQYAHKKIILNYNTLSDTILTDSSSYIAIMTFGYRSDELSIKQLIHKKCAYIGVMGSRKKMSELLSSLKQQGYSQAQLDTLHTPIGLSIQSKTPMEIAVSVAAEIISIKNKGK